MASRGRFRDWLDEALDDYAAALDLYRLNRFAKACFFCHQAAEKAVKALLIKRVGFYEPLHSVAELLRRARIYGVNVPNEILDAGEYLDRFYIPTRYPNAWPWGAPHKHYTAEDAEKAIEYARKVLEFVKREVEKDP